MQTSDQFLDRIKAEKGGAHASAVVIAAQGAAMRNVIKALSLPADEMAIFSDKYREHFAQYMATMTTYLDLDYRDVGEDVAVFLRLCRGEADAAMNTAEEVIARAAGRA